MSLEVCALALAKSGVALLPLDRDRHIRSCQTTNWEGKIVIDYKKLIQLIARDPPGHVRTGIVLPNLQT